MVSVASKFTSYRLANNITNQQTIDWLELAKSD